MVGGDRGWIGGRDAHRMRAMGRVLTLLLCLYVVLDVTNPHIPGSVTFDGGAMETAQAERHRPAARPPDEPLLEPLMLGPPPGPSVRAVIGVPPTPRIWIARRSDHSVDRTASAEEDQPASSISQRRR
jgi:hypothetical protein